MESRVVRALRHSPGVQYIATASTTASLAVRFEGLAVASRSAQDRHPTAGVAAVHRQPLSIPGRRRLVATGGQAGLWQRALPGTSLVAGLPSEQYVAKRPPVRAPRVVDCSGPLLQHYLRQLRRRLDSWSRQFRAVALAGSQTAPLHRTLTPPFNHALVPTPDAGAPPTHSVPRRALLPDSLPSGLDAGPCSHVLLA